MKAPVHLTLLAAILSLLGGCQETMPLQQIVTSDLHGDALMDTYFDRLSYLSDDPETFVVELEATGFKSDSPGREDFLAERTPNTCAVWEYYRHETPLWALIQACSDKRKNEVELRRFGIARKVMTEDELGKGVD